MTVREEELLEKLSPGEREAFERAIEPRRYEAGQSLFVQGERSDGVHFVHSGTVAVRIRLPGGGTKDLAVLGRGEVLGEMLLRSAARSASAVALETVATRFMAREDFLALYENFHPASFELMRHVARSTAARLVATNASLKSGLALSTRLDTSLFTPTPGAFFDPRPFLPKLSFFLSFTERDLDQVLSLSVLCEAPRGAVLFREGQEADSVFVVVRGALELLTGPLAAPERLALMGPGTVVGDLPAILGTAHGAACRVREDAVLLWISRASLAALLDPSRKVAFKVLRGLVSNMVATIERTNRTVARREYVRRASSPPDP